MTDFRAGAPPGLRWATDDDAAKKWPIEFVLISINSGLMHGAVDTLADRIILYNNGNIYRPAVIADPIDLPALAEELAEAADAGFQDFGGDMVSYNADRAYPAILAILTNRLGSG
jgi:hypothetical protein